MVQHLFSLWGYDNQFFCHFFRMGRGMIINIIFFNMAKNVEDILIFYKFIPQYFLILYNRAIAISVISPISAFLSREKVCPPN